MENVKLKKEIIDAHEELRRWSNLSSSHSGCLMLDTWDGKVWADLFLDENSYKVYYSDSIVRIPMYTITRSITDPKAGPPRIADIDQAIYAWCVKHMEPQD